MGAQWEIPVGQRATLTGGWHRRRRRLAVAAPLLAGLIVVGLGVRVSVRSQADPPAPTGPAGGLQVVVTAATVTAPAAGRLFVHAEPWPVPLDESANLRLTWTTPASAPYQQGVLLPSEAELTADSGPGLLAIAVGLCGAWSSDASPMQASCPAVDPRPIVAGGSMGTDLTAYPRTPHGRVAVGTYRATLPLGDSPAALHLVLVVTARRERAGDQLPAVPRVALVVAGAPLRV